MLVKPFTTQRLLERIQRSLQRDDLLTQPRQAQGEERASILVVDDTPENLQLLAGLFRDQFKVKLAHNGEKAIAICHSDNPPDLILLDVMMPDMDGFEVARRLRAAGIGFVLLTQGEVNARFLARSAFFRDPAGTLQPAWSDPDLVLLRVNPPSP